MINQNALYIISIFPPKFVSNYVLFVSKHLEKEKKKRGERADKPFIRTETAFFFIFCKLKMWNIINNTYLKKRK